MCVCVCMGDEEDNEKNCDSTTGQTMYSLLSFVFFSVVPFPPTERLTTGVHDIDGGLERKSQAVNLNGKNKEMKARDT